MTYSTTKSINELMSSLLCCSYVVIHRHEPTATVRIVWPVC